MEGNKNSSPVPFVVYESEQWRAERTEKRLFWGMLCVNIFMTICLVVSNAYWIWKDSRYEDVEETTYEVEQDADNGTNNFAGGNLNGASENKGN